MASRDKKGSPDVIEQMRSLYAAGDTAAARELARNAEQAEAGEVAQHLLRASSVDPHALLFVGIGLGVSALYAILFLQ